MITITKLKQAVVDLLKDQFPDYAVYGEGQPQTNSQRYFLVDLKSMSQTKQLNKRYYREHRFDIQFSTDQQITEVLEQLYQCLSYLPYGDGVVSGTRMNQELEDGVVHVYVNYNFRLVEQLELEPQMQNLKQEEFLNE